MTGRFEIHRRGGGITTSVTVDEMKMLSDYRREREQIAITEQNEKSSNQKAVKGIEKLSAYLEINRISFDKDPISNAIKCMEHRLKLIGGSRDIADKIRAILDEN